MKGSKIRKVGKQRRSTSPVHAVFGDPTVVRALTRFSAQFDFPGAKNKTVLYRQETIAERLVYLALAHIEVMIPKFRQMIRYCKDEGIESQSDYLASLIRTKFAKGLHIGPGEDDDDEDDPASPAPEPVGTPSTAMKP